MAMACCAKEKKKEKVEENEDDIPLYEAYWAENTTAHGISRVVATTKVHRAVWILVLVACFIYVSYEIYSSIDTYHKYLTTTEINKVNSKTIEFPAVTICNFNRWRKSYMTEEVFEQLQEVMSLYSYDYVIPDINEVEDTAVIDVAKFKVVFEEKTTKPPSTAITTTLEPITCLLPNTPPGLKYTVDGSIVNETKAELNTILKFSCNQPGTLPLDGDLEHTCGESGEFDGRIPVCVDIGDSGELYTLTNTADNRALVASTTLGTESSKAALDSMTLCFWIKTLSSHQLGTFLSYGVGDTTLLSVSQISQGNSQSIYGLGYTIFGIEGISVTLVTFNQWNPVCLQFSNEGLNSQLHSLKLYKYPLAGDSSGFFLYGTDQISDTRPFSLGGNIVLFNSYQSYLNLQAGRGITTTSAGGQIANVNMWNRLLPVEIMNRLVWSGDIVSMRPQSFTVLSGSPDSTTITFNVSNTENLRTKRQAVLEQASDAPTESNQTGNSSDGTELLLSSTSTTPSSLSVIEQSNSTLNKVFNYAAFTRTAGWQLVDDKSNHSEEEPATLLTCTYRGRKCDSRWFTHRFGSYGNCYTFNQNISQEFAEEEDFKLPLIQDSSGPIGGLNLLLDMQTWEYAETSILGGNTELGIKLVVHTPYQVPVISSMGYAMGPGQKAFVGFLKTTISNLHEPWGRCDPDRKLKNFVNYTLEGCAIECRLDKVVEACKCRPYYYPGNATICGFEDLDSCAFIEIAKINANFGNLCTCPIPCASEEFNVKLSYTKFPNQPYGVELGRLLNIKLPKPAPGVKFYESKYQYIQDNVVNLDIYLESMTETIIAQNKAMDDTALLGSVGGHLGLFIGCSVLTAFEFLECIVLSVMHHCRRRKKKQQKGENNKQTEIRLENGHGTETDNNVEEES